MLAAALASTTSAKTLRIGLAEDPDLLDPTLARTFVGRIVFASLCDKLFDIRPDLNIVPQLATGYEWSADNKALTLKLRQGVMFHDGEPFNAAAVKFNIERHLTMQGSTARRDQRDQRASTCSTSTRCASTSRTFLTALARSPTAPA